MSKAKTKAKPAKEEVVRIPRADIKRARITIVGKTALLVNRFDEKSIQQIEDNYRGVAKNKGVPRSAEEEYESSLYRMPDNPKVYAVPVAGIKKCAVSACRYVDGIAMTEAKGSFHVLEVCGGMVPIKSKKGPRVDERIVRVGNFGNKKPAKRRRGIFDDWEITFDVEYNSGVINLEQILNLYENAGFSIGLHEYRPEKDGNLGMFSVKRA